MSGLILLLSILTAFVVAAVIVGKKQRRVMREGKLLKSETVYQDGEKFYVEKVMFKDWHASIHSYYGVFY